MIQRKVISILLVCCLLRVPIMGSNYDRVGKRLPGTKPKADIMSYYFVRMDSGFWPYPYMIVPVTIKENDETQYRKLIDALNDTDTDIISEALADMTDEIRELAVEIADWLTPVIIRDDNTHSRLTRDLEPLYDYWDRLGNRGKEAEAMFDHLLAIDTHIRTVRSAFDRASPDAVRDAINTFATVYEYEEPILWLYFKALENNHHEYIDICLSALEDMGDKVQNRTPIIITALDCEDKNIRDRARRFIEQYPPYRVENLVALISLYYACQEEKYLIPDFRDGYVVGASVQSARSKFQQLENKYKSQIIWLEQLIDSYIANINKSQKWYLFGIDVPDEVLVESISKIRAGDYDILDIRSHTAEVFYKTYFQSSFSSSDFIRLFSERASVFLHDFDIVDSLKGPLFRSDRAGAGADIMKDLFMFSENQLGLKDFEKRFHEHTRRHFYPEDCLTVFRDALSFTHYHNDPHIRQVALYIIYQMKDRLHRSLQVISKCLFTYFISTKDKDLAVSASRAGTYWGEEKLALSSFLIEPETREVDWSDRREWAPLAKKWHPDKRGGDEADRKKLEMLLQQRRILRKSEDFEKSVTEEIEKLKILRSASALWEREKIADVSRDVCDVPIYISDKPHLLAMVMEGKKKSFILLHLEHNGSRYIINDTENKNSLKELLEDKDCIIAHVSKSTSRWNTCMELCERFSLPKDERDFIFGKFMIRRGMRVAREQKALTDGKSSTALVKLDLTAQIKKRMEEAPIIHVSECPELMQMFFSLGDQYEPVLKAMQVKDEDRKNMTNFDAALNTYSKGIFRESLGNFTSQERDVRAKVIYYLTATCKEDKDTYKRLDLLYDIAKGIFVDNIDDDVGKMALDAARIIDDAIALRETLDTLSNPEATKDNKIDALELSRLFGYEEMLYLGLYDDDEDVRKKALEGILALGIKNKKAIEPLVSVGGIARETVIDAMKDEDELLRQGVIDALVDIGEGAVNFLIEKGLGHRNLRVKRESARALAKIGKPAVPSLVHKLEIDLETIKDTGNRALAARILGEIGDERAVGPLVKRLDKDYSIGVRILSAETLAKMGVEKGLEFLISMMAENKSAERVLVRIGKPAVKHLIEALGDESVFRSKKASNILVKIGEPAVEELAQALEHKNFEIRRKVHDVLVRIDKPAYKIEARINRHKDTDL